MQDVATDCNVAVLFQDGIRKTIGRSNADPLSEEHRPCGSLLIPAVRPSLCCRWEPCPLLRISPVLGFRWSRAHSMTGPTSVFLSSCLPLSHFIHPLTCPFCPPPRYARSSSRPPCFTLLSLYASCHPNSFVQALGVAVTSRPNLLGVFLQCLSSPVDASKPSPSPPSPSSHSQPSNHISLLPLSASPPSLPPLCCLTARLSLSSVSRPPFLPSRSLFSLLCMTVSEVCSQVCSHLISQFLLG